MSSTSQVILKYCSKCKSEKDGNLFGRHVWCKPCCKAYNDSVRGRARKPTYDENRKRRLYTRFRVTVNDYNNLLSNQLGGCAICGVKSNLNHKTFDMDHSHVTGKLRGLLCRNCNTALGQFKDNTTLLLKAVDYLEGYQ